MLNEASRIWKAPCYQMAKDKFKLFLQAFDENWWIFWTKSGLTVSNQLGAFQPFYEI